MGAKAVAGKVCSSRPLVVVFVCKLVAMTQRLCDVCFLLQNTVTLTLLGDISFILWACYGFLGVLSYLGWFLV